MQYEEMRAMEKTHLCAQCGSNLVTIWDQDFGEYELVCAADHHHTGYQRVLSVNEDLARGTLGDKLGKGGQKGLEKMAEAGAPALSKMPEKDIATGEPIAGDKGLALVQWATKLNLKPYLGHVCLYFGKPYVTIDGYYYLNNKRDDPYRVGTRPMNNDERRYYAIADGDVAWLGEAWLGDYQLPTTGLGIVTKEEVEGKSTRNPEGFRAPVVHGHPQRMAEKRAEWQLLRKLIPLEEQE